MSGFSGNHRKTSKCLTTSGNGMKEDVLPGLGGLWQRPEQPVFFGGSLAD